MGDEGADAVTGDGQAELNGDLPASLSGGAAAAADPPASQNEPAGQNAPANRSEPPIRPHPAGPLDPETALASDDDPVADTAAGPDRPSGPDRPASPEAAASPEPAARADTGPDLPIAPVRPFNGVPNPFPGPSRSLPPVPVARQPVAPQVARQPLAPQPEPPAGEPRRRGPLRLRTALAVGAGVAVLLGGITTVASRTVGRDRAGQPIAVTTGPGVAQNAPAEGAGAGVGSSSPVVSASATPPAGATVTLAGTGDIVMGRAPGNLPPNDAVGFFDPVASAFTSDLLMGNLEQTLTDDTGTAKCSAGNAGKTCFAFRTPPGYAGVLRDAGFDVMNMANNHAYDFGQRGYANTQQSLETVGLHHTGAPGLITVVPVGGVRVAVIGFAPYTWANDINDIAGAAALVTKASQQADLVVVQAHLGAEGADRTHVRPGTETYLGENRGDPIRFAHAVVDAGADLVIGHGPHVMRGAEFYKGRLIAYSLGNFAGYKALGSAGLGAVGGVLRVTLQADGTYLRGSLVSTAMNGDGLPRPDPRNQAISLVGNLSKEDFGSAGARIDQTGAITPQ